MVQLALVQVLDLWLGWNGRRGTLQIPMAWHPSQKRELEQSIGSPRYHHFSAMKLLSAFLCGAMASMRLCSVQSWAPSPLLRHTLARHKTNLNFRPGFVKKKPLSEHHLAFRRPFALTTEENDTSAANVAQAFTASGPYWLGGAMVFLVLLAPECAGAVSAPNAAALPSALAAFAHYFSIVLMTASITAERLIIKPAMSIEDEQMLGTADILAGIAGLSLVTSGYFRAIEYGKGWEFYMSEPAFWLKMLFIGFFGGISIFPTLIILQRTAGIRKTGSIQPMSEELANRMKQIMDLELVGLSAIPLSAAMMARGVGHVDNFPTSIVGPILVAMVTIPVVYKCTKDATKWGHDEAATKSLTNARAEWNG